MTVPATSLPGTNGSAGLNWYWPRVCSSSGKETPAQCTSTSTPLPGCQRVAGLGRRDLDERERALGAGLLRLSGRPSRRADRSCRRCLRSFGVARDREADQQRDVEREQRQDSDQQSSSGPPLVSLRRKTYSIRPGDRPRRRAAPSGATSKKPLPGEALDTRSRARTSLTSSQRRGAEQRDRGAQRDVLREGGRRGRSGRRRSAPARASPSAVTGGSASLAHRDRASLVMITASRSASGPVAPDGVDEALHQFLDDRRVGPRLLQLGEHRDVRRLEQPERDHRHRPRRR